MAITLNKVRHQVARHQADKRSIRREQDLLEAITEPLVRRPSPEHVIAAADELEQIMGALPPLKRRILELRLLDYEVSEIAADIGRSERTVRRMLDDLHDVLKRRLLDS